MVTVLDVIEGFFGAFPTRADVLKLSLAEVEELGELAVQSAEAQPAPKDPALIYPGGLLGAHWQEPIFRRELSLALLYQPRLLVHDPLAEFFFDQVERVPRPRPLRTSAGHIVETGPDQWVAPHLYRSVRARPDDARNYLARVIESVGELAPLLRSGVVVARSQWPVVLDRATEIATSARHDVRSAVMSAIAKEAAETGTLPVWDNLRGMHVSLSEPWVAADQPWQWHPEFLYLAKTLAIADAAGATYAPMTSDELRLLRAKATILAREASRRHVKLEVLQEVASVLLPSAEMAPSTAVAMRQSDEAFEDWCATLRDIQRAASSAETPEELSDAVRDLLEPRAHAVTRTMKSKPSALDVVEGAVTTVVSGVVTGVGLTASAMSGLGAGVLSWLWRAYGPRHGPSGAEAVMAALLTDRQHRR